MRRLTTLLFALAALTLAAQKTPEAAGPPYRVGGDVKAPVVLSHVDPVYPPEARANRISGIVMVEAVIDQNGDVRDVKVLKPLPHGLDQAAVDAVKQWKFRPGTMAGKPVDVIFNLMVNFKLHDDEPAEPGTLPDYMTAGRQPPPRPMPSPLTTVILVRHAEKGTVPASDPPLSEAGRQRAQNLSRILGANPITAIYTTPYARTRETAAPLAAAVHLKPVEMATGETYARDIVQRVHQQRGGTHVVVGHSNTTREVLRAFGITDAPEIAESEYDNLYVLTFGPMVETRLLKLRY
jgi:TonB family protein